MKSIFIYSSSYAAAVSPTWNQQRMMLALPTKGFCPAFIASDPNHLQTPVFPPSQWIANASQRIYFKCYNQMYIVPIRSYLPPISEPVFKAAWKNTGGNFSSHSQDGTANLETVCFNTKT